MKHKIRYIVIALAVVLVGAFGYVMIQNNNSISYNDSNLDNLATAYFAGGCFWCVEADYEKFTGVTEAISGYMGGVKQNPKYADHGDHREAVEVYYDPDLVSYTNLVEYFFRYHDPTDPGGSFYDRGHSYTSAIYPQNDQEESIARLVIKDLDDEKIFDELIVTAVERDAVFWIAEDYHQDYYKKNPIRYKAYRYGSGRDSFIEAVWGDRDDFEIVPDGPSHRWVSFEKPSDQQLKQTLSPLSYQVTQREGTEPPNTEGSYDKNYQAGIYVDIVSSEPLFSSRDKFDSGTGWPSFTRPISSEFVVTQTDYKLVLPRTEIRSRYADSHIGHLFSDGPEPTGQRWCINGSALSFIPLGEMEERGFEDYVRYVE